MAAAAHGAPSGSRRAPPLDGPHGAVRAHVVRTSDRIPEKQIHWLKTFPGKVTHLRIYAAMK